MVIEAGRPAPEFSLATAGGGAFTRADLIGRTTVLVFYPFAFSPTCTDTPVSSTRPRRVIAARFRSPTALRPAWSETVFTCAPSPGVEMSTALEVATARLSQRSAR